MDGSDQLEGGRQAYARQAWGDAYAQLSVADSQSELEPADLERLAPARPGVFDGFFRTQACDRLRAGIVERLVAVKPRLIPPAE